eukprot:TRINITY_DN9642_c0_g1_i2.p1 TRINITY_DN9642_c0_g1~~TRINITY_DN9642_c0_g1_i2.p1  ORF type:complete len:374 (-),score=79.75 TRINITY_DN9642_c0_g1_i2:147-1268(-)
MSGTSVTPRGLAALSALVAQNTALVLLMRWTVTNSSGFISSTAVVCDEAMKLIVCTLVMIGYYVFRAPGDAHMKTVPEIDDEKAKTRGRKSLTGCLRFLRREIFGHGRVTVFKMAVPALAYTVQKNCLYVAIMHLEAAVYQVTYQAKILTTALFSCLLLKKPMSRHQVGALIILMVGLAMVQVANIDTKTTPADYVQRPILGIMAVTVACMTSGFSSVYFELMLKSPSFAHSGVDQALAQEFAMWVSNFQLAMFALIVAVFGAYINDGERILEAGFFRGYGPTTMVMITLEAFGGIIVAFVIKYTDNILKNFAAAISIVSSTAVSSLAMDFRITPGFVFGTCQVLGAIVLYQRNPPTATNACACDCRRPRSRR